MCCNCLLLIVNISRQRLAAFHSVSVTALLCSSTVPKGLPMHPCQRSCSLVTVSADETLRDLMQRTEETRKRMQKQQAVT